MPREEAVIGLRRRLRLEFGGDDVEHVFKVMPDGEPLHHRVGMLLGAVGEDELAARQLLDRGAERGIRLERGMVDLVHEIEIIVRVHAVLGHHPAHRGAVALVIILLQLEGVVARDFQEIGDVVADALVHLLPEIEVMRIQRVVEIEDPGLDIGEAA